MPSCFPFSSDFTPSFPPSVKAGDDSFFLDGGLICCNNSLYLFPIAVYFPPFFLVFLFFKIFLPRFSPLPPCLSPSPLPSSSLSVPLPSPLFLPVCPFPPPPLFSFL